MAIRAQSSVITCLLRSESKWCLARCLLGVQPAGLTKVYLSTEWIKSFIHVNEMKYNVLELWKKFWSWENQKLGGLLKTEKNPQTTACDVCLSVCLPVSWDNVGTGPSFCLILWLLSQCSVCARVCGCLYYQRVFISSQTDQHRDRESRDDAGRGLQWCLSVVHPRCLLHNILH